MTDQRLSFFEALRKLVRVFARELHPEAVAARLYRLADRLNEQKGFPMLRPLRIGSTAGNVPHVRFEDCYGDRASFQDGPDHRQFGKTLWFGKDGARISVDRERAAQLAEIFERFARTGSIAE